MRRLADKVRELASFLWLDGDGQVLPSSFRSMRRLPEGRVESGRCRSARISVEGLAGREDGALLEDCLVTGGDATLPFGGGHWIRCRGDRLSLDCQGGSLEASLCDLAGLSARGDLSGSRLHLCSLRDATLSGLDLSGAEALATDFSGARFDDVDLRGARLTSCDFAGCSFRNVRFEGTDLSGSSLAFASFEGCTFDEVGAQMLRLRGVRGLSSSQHSLLREAGARPSIGPVQQGLQSVAARFLGPGAAAEAAGLWATRLTLGTGVLVVPVLLAVQTVQHAGIQGREGLGHFSDEDVSFGAEYTDVTPDIVEATLGELRRGRDGIEAFHARSGRYPTLAEMEDNRGPTGVILTEGPLENPITVNQNGWVEYCDVQPRQSHLTGDDNDWHYCPETGALYACGGMTTAQTGNW